jgi:hypothetical protein
MNENEERFELFLEADMFHTVREFSSGRYSYFSSESRLGWIYFDSRDAELTDEDVLDYLMQHTRRRVLRTVSGLLWTERHTG